LIDWKQFNSLDDEVQLQENRQSSEDEIKFFFQFFVCVKGGFGYGPTTHVFL